MMAQVAVGTFFMKSPVCDTPCFKALLSLKMNETSIYDRIYKLAVLQMEILE